MIKIYKADYVFDQCRNNLKTNIVIQDVDTLGAAANFIDPACLNFASHKRPGGGYKSVLNLPIPIKTQEEDLFRRSNLPDLMDNKHIRQHYPLKGLNGIYTSNIEVNRNEKLIPHDPYTISLITVAAVVNPTDADVDLVKDKIKLILNIAANHNHHDLILGAWGCGVFRNDPITIATVFKNFLNNEFQGCFENVVFAIPGKQSKNYKAFESVFA